jgi:flagellar biosynthetic protein FliO
MRFLIRSVSENKKLICLPLLAALIAAGSGTAFAGRQVETGTEVIAPTMVQDVVEETPEAVAMAEAEQGIPAAVPSVPSDQSVTAAPVSEESLAEAQSGSMGGYGIRAAGALILILATIWLGMILLKRFMPHRFGPLGQKRRIQVIETVPIGEKRTLTLVRIDNEELLLASTPGSLALLKEIRRDQTTEAAAPVQQLTAEAKDASGPVARTTDDDRKFEEVLADQVQSAQPASGSLSRLTFLRQELEAR